MENARFPNDEESSVRNSVDFSAVLAPVLTLRQDRVIEALSQTAEWLSREAIDDIAGASNGPQIILELRRKVTGHDGIEMQRMDTTDRDGKVCKPGRYRLTPIGRQRVQQAMASHAGGVA